MLSGKLVAIPPDLLKNLILPHRLSHQSRVDRSDSLSRTGVVFTLSFALSLHLLGCDLWTDPYYRTEK